MSCWGAPLVETFVMDTSGWIEFFRKSDAGESIRSLIVEGNIVTPAIVMGELRKKYIEEGYVREKFEEDYDEIQFLGAIEDLTPDIAIEAGEMRATCGTRGISLVDCIVLTLAKRLEGKAISTDKHFREQEHAIHFQVEE